MAISMSVILVSLTLPLAKSYATMGRRGLPYPSQDLPVPSLSPPQGMVDYRGPPGWCLALITISMSVALGAARSCAMMGGRGPSSTPLSPQESADYRILEGWCLALITISTSVAVAPRIMRSYA